MIPPRDPIHKSDSRLFPGRHEAQFRPAPALQFQSPKSPFSYLLKIKNHLVLQPIYYIFVAIFTSGMGVPLRRLRRSRVGLCRGSVLEDACGVPRDRSLRSAPLLSLTLAASGRFTLSSWGNSAN